MSIFDTTEELLQRIDKRSEKLIDEFHEHRQEYEAEINLLAMLPIPLVVFAISTAIWGLGGASPLPPWIGHAAIPGVALGICFFLLFRLHPLRREEAEWWFRFFLMSAERAETQRSVT